MITIPDEATPADVVGETDILAGQPSLQRERVLLYAQQMEEGTFPWEKFQRRQPMAFQEGSNGKVIDQGHHRWVAARLAGTEIPVAIELRRDFWPGPVPYGRSWKEVTWE